MSSNDPTEIWRDVVGYEGDYQVSNLGRVRSTDRTVTNSLGRTYFIRGEVRRVTLCRGNRYKIVILSKDGKRVGRSVHQLVLRAFVGPPPDEHECRHLDGDATNNRLDNLCWGTRSENAKDRTRHGTSSLLKMSKEERSAAGKKAVAARDDRYTHEERSEWARRRWASRTQEQTFAITKKGREAAAAKLAAASVDGHGK